MEIKSIYFTKIVICLSLLDQLHKYIIIAISYLQKIWTYISTFPRTL
ncbi:hypothetical protein BCG9842_B4098 [Bacillus cereus G9842]|uniref:Uncharacterized protein n=1 Tax=Bacillus cereus (strain G9842) TaxID=405531 RepID=B7ILD4_BACC2|nr:hypothetical protein BCG9842_B4098 [Bacillus cereus G9842]